MPRSNWKGPYNVKFSRSTMITPSLIGNIVAVYSGNNFNEILIRPEHVGYKLGEFCFTRQKHIFKKKKKKK